MKKLRVISSVLLIIILFSLTGCSAGKNDDLSGTWYCINAEMNETKLAIKDAFSDPPVLELKSFGKAILKVNGDSMDFRWSVSDTGEIVLKSGQNIYTGSVRDEMIRFDLLLGIKMVFSKDSLEKYDVSNSDIEEEVTAFTPVGVWQTRYAYSAKGKKITSILGFEIDSFLMLTINNDGTARVEAMGMEYDGEWTSDDESGGSVSANGMTMEYSVSDDNMLVFEYNGMDFYLERVSAVALEDDSEETESHDKTDDDETDKGFSFDGSPFDYFNNEESREVIGEIIEGIGQWWDENHERMGV